MSKLRLTGTSWSYSRAVAQTQVLWAVEPQAADLGGPAKVEGAPGSLQKTPESRTTVKAGTLPSAPLSPTQRAWLCERLQGSVVEVGAHLEASTPHNQS